MTKYTQIPRVYDNLEKYLKKNTVLVIYGPRRVGKTTILKNFLKSYKGKYKLSSGDDIDVQEIVGSSRFSTILEYASNIDLLAIDEAQKIRGVGQGLKIIVDQIEGIIVIATGSSSFDLANQVGEPLTGRKKTLTLYPIAQKELKDYFGVFELKKKLPEFLVFGSYPTIITAKTKEEKTQLLLEIVNSYLLKDILALDNIKNSTFIINLLKLLAFQVGSEVSLNELGTQLNADVKTVARYLDLLEKTFVITRLGGYSSNLRKEVTDKYKYYFWDNGIRNAIISQFNNLEDRNDVGQLWENFIVIERLKKLSYDNIYGNRFFWRTYDQKEIDLIEERDGKLFGYEIKWGTKKVKNPDEFLKTYNNASFKVISQDNYIEFIS
ncbi:MAG: ATP-binding protein [bacterium]|nr:ATP-binding protein [bacterium]